MNILYTNFHVGPNRGGHTIYIAQLAQSLMAQHSISIAAPAGCALMRLTADLDGVKGYPIKFTSRLYRMTLPAKELRAILIREKFDIVHVNGSADHKLVILASLFLRHRPKIVLTKHNDQPVSQVSSRFRVWAGTDHVIAVCDHVRRRLAKTAYAKIGISTVFNGVDTATFRPRCEKAKREARVAYLGTELAGKIVVGSNAGTGGYKSWMDMVRAVALLPLNVRTRFHVAVAGSPIRKADMAEIHDMVMDEHFTYVGTLEDVKPFISAIDVGYVLSHRVETISFACREMMACGKPVIVTDHGGLPENIVHNYDGWIVPTRSPRDLAALLLEIANEVYDLVEMGRVARKKAVAEFGHGRFVDGTRQVYTRVVYPKR